MQAACTSYPCCCFQLVKSGQSHVSHGGSSWSHDSHTGDVGVPSPLLKVPAGQVATGLGGGGEGEGEDGGVTQQACLHFAESRSSVFSQSFAHFLWPTPPQPGFALGLHRRCTFFESFSVHVVGSSSAAQLSMDGGGLGGGGGSTTT